ncbi:MAG TPA: tetratricopeptide repeat protein [Candidatus Polarisedimenticolaceae bacterium]|nr:tetratricopeptide repeat protein [Candidatus Polarisedimenticolaceae bacterium]
MNVRLNAAAGALVLFAFSNLPAESPTDELLRYGTEMAKEGNWREAKYRWERALRDDPSDARLLNNLAVASEALGDADAARSLFEKAVAASPRDARIRDNAARSAIFWRKVSDDGKAGPGVPLEGSKKKGHDMVEVTVSLPMPARVKVDGAKTLLVAGFIVNDSDLVDVNREIVHFLRNELRKHTSFAILDVTPPPAVPEQTLDDMAKNAEFFKWLGREHGADIVVSGAVHYTKRDASGFEDVDIVSESTGQKVRQTRFVEQEEFTFELEALYFRGADGSLLFRDKTQRQAVYRGSANDPISAFYELGNAASPDVLAVLAPRNLPDVRLLFKG